MRIHDLAGVATLAVALLVSTNASAQQELVLSKGLDGTHVGPVLADDPSTGNTLVVWITAGDDGRVLWGRLLKSKKAGYSTGKLFKIADSESGSVANRSPEVVFSPVMKNFFVVWQADLEDGSSEVRSRILRRKTGKPKGGIKVVAGDGAVNTSPAVDSAVLDGAARTLVAYMRRAAGGSAPYAYEVVGREVKKNGKPNGPAFVLNSRAAGYAYVGRTFLVGDGAAARVPGAGYYLVIDGPTKEGDSDDELCFLTLYRDGVKIHEVEAKCDGYLRVSATSAALVIKGKGTGYSEHYYEIQGETIVETETSGQIDGGDFGAVFFSVIAADLDRYQRVGGQGLQRDAGTDLLASTHDDGKVYLLRVPLGGTATLSQLFTYYGATRGVRTVATGKNGPDTLVSAWIGQRNRDDDEEVRATILDTPR